MIFFFKTFDFCGIHVKSGGNQCEEMHPDQSVFPQKAVSVVKYREIRSFLAKVWLVWMNRDAEVAPNNAGSDSTSDANACPNTMHSIASFNLLSLVGKHIPTSTQTHSHFCSLISTKFLSATIDRNMQKKILASIILIFQSFH